jgi:hypothetical protein
VIRRLVPYLLLPLSLIACALASSPWLRAFPSGVMSIPLFGAALLSVLAPLIVVGIGLRKLWATALIDLVLFIFYELLVTLRAPAGFDSLYNGLVHGPSQILTFALPLVSPRTLLVAPVALCWISGAIIGECVARGWQSVLPYVTLLVTFGLSYAGTARAITSSADGRRYDTLLAGALLFALLLLRAAQAWVIQDHGAETTQPDGVLPLRGLAIGTVLSVAIALGAAGLVQSNAFTGRPVTPARVPPLDQGQPLTPVSFVAGLRPSDPKSKGKVLFRVTTDRTSSSYISLATVDFYDGDGWSFSRTFRPSGGVIPVDTDPSLRPHGGGVDQQYSIDAGPMTSVPWMPYLNRAEKVTGTSVNIDAQSGMIVPTRTLHAGSSYTVHSDETTKTFDQLTKTAAVGSGLQTDTTLANDLSDPLGALITSLAQETGTSSSQIIPFLQAVAKDFRTRSSLAGAPATTTPTPSAPPSTTPAKTSGAKTSGAKPTHPPAKPPRSTKKSAKRPGHHFLGAIPDAKSSTHKRAPRTTPRATTHAVTTPTPTPTPSASAHSGGTTFADVLASIRASHSATPEQYATLMALVARKLNVPARLVSGFRVSSPNGGATLPAGTYNVTTAEAWTWVEIPISGLGWVVLDPSPGTYSGVAPQQSASAQPTQSPSPSPTNNALLTQANNGNAVSKPSKIPHSSSSSAATIVLVIVIAWVVLVAVLVALLLTRKRVRARRRRRTGDPRRRLLGAWQESLDVLVESGLPDLTYLTSAEVATTTGERFGGEPAAQARYIGDAANLAIFSPTSWVGPGEAEAAWRAQAVLSKAVRRRLGWRDRIGAGLRYHRNRTARAQVGPTSWSAAAKVRSAASGRGRHARPGRRRARRSPSK